MILKIRKWFRWKIAHFLNNFAETCWADLVMFALYPKEHSLLELNPYRGLFKETVWEQVCSEDEGGYCGKCEITGRVTARKDFEKEDDLWRFPFELPNRNVEIKFGGGESDE